MNQQEHEQLIKEIEADLAQAMDAILELPAERLERIKKVLKFADQVAERKK